MAKKKYPVLKDKTDIIIGKERIEPGEIRTLRMIVGRLPSDTQITISANVFRSENPGPCALVLGGVHGDEINGIEIIRQCLENDVFDDILRGTVIAIPLLNVFGFINFSRDVPDGKDVNRSFPGNTTGSLASRVARTLTKQILPNVNFAMDFHTGGGSRYNYPQIRYTKSDAAAQELAQIFSAPYTIQKPMIPKSFRRSARDLGIPTIVYEAGESVRFDGYSIDEGILGLKRVLKAKGMIAEATESSHTSVHLVKTSWIRAPYSGLFTWAQSSGAYVEKGSQLGRINDPHGRKSVSVVSKTAGHIIGHNNASVVNQGDALFHIGYE